ncbi:hypothetical protein KY289_005162 [Solanum tuberosum]|nr:hypothetical protein KY289_005162 [Solanum tuberosum]
MDDAPSFSIGITQIMSSNNNRVFDHKDAGWAESRSKKLHDPLIMAKVSIEKVRKNVPSSSKSKVEKTPKKRVRKVSSPISRPNLPKNSCNDIHPTSEEMASLDLPGNVDASHNEHQNSATKSKLVQPQELSGFEDFSTNPTDHFLRRSRRASTTSSTPPPKRRKNAHPVKPDVIDVNQPEQSTVQSNKNSPIPILGVNVPDVHVPSLDPKEPIDRSGIKQVKKYLKKYIDKKFQHLEDLIKLNHKQLMNVVRNPHKQEEENISGTSTSLNMPEFNQEDHIVRPPTTNQLFDKRSSPIAMDMPDNDRFEVDVVEDREQNLIPEPKTVEDVTTCKEKEGRKDVTDLPHITEVHDEANVHQQDNEDVPVRGSKTFHQVMLDEHDADKVKDNVIKSDKSGSINSDSVSAGTQEAVDTLYGIHAPMDAQPLQVVTPQQLTDTHDLRSRNLVPMDTNINEIVVHEVSKTPIQRLRLPSKIFQSPYVTIFGSSDKGKEKVDSELHIRPNHPFQDCGIIFQPPSALLDQYHQWLSKGLLKTHDKKKSKEDKYKCNSASFGFEQMDFVVAFPINKNWFYAMSQPKKCWTDEHIDVVFYYLRKKSKLRSLDQYRYTTVNCLFKTYINNTHERYHCSLADDNLSTQEHMARGSVVSGFEQSMMNIINGFEIPAGLPWHSCDDVYIPVNCDGQFHWVLAVVVLKKRLIRVYDSASGSRRKKISGDIKKLSLMLPTYFQDSGFFDHFERTDWSSLDAYKDKETGSLLEPKHPFLVEYVQDIIQQGSDTLDCGLFVAAFVEFLSDEIPMQSNNFRSDYLRSRYAALLWNYGSEKAEAGYVSDNDDPAKPRGHFTPPNHDALVNLE